MAQWFPEDASCGPVNPMTGLMKQFTQDSSSQHDKFSTERYGEGSSRGAFRTQTNINRQEDEYAQKFFQYPGQESSHPPNLYNLDEMSKELEAIRHDIPRNGDWAVEFLKQPKIIPNHVHPEFEEFNMIYKNAQNQNNWVSQFQQQRQAGNIEIHPEEITAFEQAFEDAKKSASWESEFKAQEQSWANEFKQQEEAADAKTELASVASKLVASVEGETNPKFKSSSFFQFMKKLSKQELSIEGNKIVENAPISNENWASEFSQQQNNNNWASEFTNKQTNSWTREFNENTRFSGTTKNGESDWATEFQKTDNQINDTSSTRTASDNWVKDFSLEKSVDQTMEDLKKDWENYQATSSGYSYNYNDYEFSQNNPFLNMPNLSSMKGQNLAESILILEAKVQLDPNDSYAWYQLGTRQQENEQEPKAIAALRKAATLNPQILDSWLSLAVSYTNEYRRDDVYDVLESWFEHNSKYKKLLEQQRAKANFVDPHEFFTDLFIQAALLNPGENLDPDVQIGLGILYNVSEEYNKAIDCFQSALSLRPNDYLLWNKLGATMANAREPEKAANAYFNALEINPSYVRARYNLAISFINMKEYRDAVEHLLAALALQAGETDGITNNSLNVENSSFKNITEKGMSSNIWDTLKMCCGFLDRPDLESKCDERDLNSFKQEFEFI
ncbi:unnamed protein product [Rhizophagus irregularis]|uniref:TPR-like protein n=1 Tax=Rhizophagus irregularis TaxID=588596 RepID=A0A2N1P1E2_9GLOM|nr:TPR-like protein [Rhizophagus irregularis]CAB4375108.1 unnamed protein product [Rhizophagus irregularis]CAB5305544.1 unnamed protein product [Rhizophagus irregularis]